MDRSLPIYKVKRKRTSKEEVYYFQKCEERNDRTKPTDNYYKVVQASSKRMYYNTTRAVFQLSTEMQLDIRKEIEQGPESHSKSLSVVYLYSFLCTCFMLLSAT